MTRRLLGVLSACHHCFLGVDLDDGLRDLGFLFDVFLSDLASFFLGVLFALGLRSFLTGSELSLVIYSSYEMTKYSQKKAHSLSGSSHLSFIV